MKIAWESPRIQTRSCSNPMEHKSWRWFHRKTWDFFCVHCPIPQPSTARLQEGSTCCSLHPWGERKPEGPQKPSRLRTPAALTTITHTHSSCHPGLQLTSDDRTVRGSHHCVPLSRAVAVSPGTRGATPFLPSTYSPSVLVSQPGHPCPWAWHHDFAPWGRMSRRSQQLLPTLWMSVVQWKLYCHLLKIESYNHEMLYVSLELTTEKKPVIDNRQ